MRFTPRALLVLVCMTAGYASQLPRNVYSQNGDGWEHFRIARGGDRILLPVELTGKIYPFLLDSGSSHHGFDITLRKHLGNVLEAGTASFGGSSRMRIEKFTTPSLRIGTLVVVAPPDRVSAVLDFARLREAMEQDIRGVIGASFFREKLVQIDFDQGRLSVASRTKKHGYLGKQIPIRIDGDGVSSIDGVQIGDHSESFKIATGAYIGVELHRWLFNALLNDGQMSLEDGQVSMRTLVGQRRFWS